MNRKSGCKRILACFLALVLMLPSLSGIVLAEDGMDSMEPAVTADGGVLSESGETPEAEEETANKTEISEATPAPTPAAVLEEPETKGEDSQNSLEDMSSADTFESPGETGEEIQNAITVTVAEWTWVDPEGYLQETEGVWGLGLAGAGEDNPLTQETLLELLPGQIQAVTDQGETVNLDLAWDLSAVPAEGLTEGTHTFTAALPEGYVLGEGAGSLEVRAELGGAEVYTELPTGSASSAPFQDHIINGVSPTGTTINLFDYWLTERTAADNEDPEWVKGVLVNDQGWGSKEANVPTLQNAGINDGHAFLFGANLGGNFGTWNQWTGTWDVRSGIVQNTLSEDGYPVLNLTQQQVNSARYNETSKDSQGRDYLTGYYYNTLTNRNPNESLAYLFDSSSGDGKQAYSDVKGLLQVDKDGYYYYDSTLNYAAFYEEDNSFVLYDTKGVNAGGNDNTKNGQFFPFNAADDVLRISGNNLISVQENYGQGNVDIKSTSTRLNHFFGLSMSTRFVQQYKGYTDESHKKAVTYEFSGDDDVWVFIDGKLVADLGGIHNAASLEINFATGEISINGQVQDQKLGRILGYDSNVLPDNTYHTLDFFYLERGNTDSNMSLRYNLVTIPETSVIKVDQTGDPVMGAEFKLLYKSADSEIEIARGTTNSNGEFVFTSRDETTGNEFPITLQSLYDTYGDALKNGNGQLILRETKIPDGYRSAGEMELYFGNDNSQEVVLLSKNHWETGAYAMPKVTTTAPDTVYFVNGSRSINLKSTDPESFWMFAVVMQKQDDGSWKPIYGDPLNGWNVTDSSDIWENIKEAVRANTYVFQLASSGAYQVEVENLPGDVMKYYYMCGENEEKAEYTVAYYYTTAQNINNISPQNTHRLDAERTEIGQEFDRVFSANLYVPNIKNHLLVQKVDEEGNALTGATFTLYKSNADGTRSEEVVDSVTTENLSTPVILKGGGIFPTDGKVLKTGVYYLVETAPPAGHVKNTEEIKIVVDNTGVYADAGTAEDDVSVLRGVGSIVKSMVQFAVDDNVDTTLHNIQAVLTSGTYNSTGADGNFNWNPVEDTAWNQALHLQYANANKVLDYGRQDNLPGTIQNLTIETDAGWSKLLIRQCSQHKTDAGTVQDLGTTDITNLFSGTVTVRVVNQRETVSVKATKNWVDNNNSGNTRPEKILLQLFQNGEQYGAQIEVTAANTGEWTYTWENLPKYAEDNMTAYQYTVQEVPVGGYSSSISGDMQAGFTITNTLNPALTITKEVTGDYGDRTKEFTFTMILTDKTNNPISGAYPASGKDSLTEVVFDSNGSATFTLRHGESITIKNLPIDATYTVIEAREDEYTTTYSINDETQPNGSASGKLPGSTVTEVKVVNHRSDIPATGLYEHRSSGTWMFGAALLLGLGSGGVFLAKRRTRGRAGRR